MLPVPSRYVNTFVMSLPRGSAGVRSMGAQEHGVRS